MTINITYAINDTAKSVYSCISSYGNIIKYKLADKDILLPRTGMPAILSGTSEIKCMIYKRHKLQNNIILQKHNFSILRNVISDIANDYSEYCNNKACNKSIDCKIYSAMIAKNINKYISIQANILPETKIILINPIIDNKNCIAKIDNIYTSKNLLLYKDESCINQIASQKDNYINLLIENKHSSWSAEFINCLEKI